MNPFTVLVTAPSVSEQAQKLLRDAGAEIIFMKNPITEDALVAEFSRRKINTVLLRGPTPFTPAVFAAAKDLRIISKNGAGIDSLNLEAATAHGVAVMVANGANADAVAEHALTLMLCLTREMPRFDRELRKGVWKDQRTLVRDFRGRSVGIVGYGNIGQRTARLASACGANVVIYSRSRVAVPEAMQWEESLERLLGRVDILSLHCPLNEQTSKLIGEKQFQLMQPGALI
ncbi:MAG TPA: NAD(P)-dependent oxidoreductase, partial [Burkholderiales bacterium]|nr:NAD(P)-dependent oxidoreductase [Burkholderiales bacterium]